MPWNGPAPLEGNLWHRGSCCSSDLLQPLWSLPVWVWTSTIRTPQQLTQWLLLERCRAYEQYDRTAGDAVAEVLPEGTLGRRIAGTKKFQLAPEWVDWWCWNDISTQCVPNLVDVNANNDRYNDGREWKSPMTRCDIEIWICASNSLRFFQGFLFCQTLYSCWKNCWTYH